MPNCHQDTARRGWELFKRSDPPPSLEELNKMLQVGGVNESVAQRTYRHYRRLKNNGFVEYMPINELDVRLKLANGAGHPQESAS